MRERLLELLKTNAYKHGDYTLSSGRKSEHYVNCKPVTLNGEGLHLVSNCLLQFVHPLTKAVAGLTLGADPLVAGVSVASYQYISCPDLDALIVRKEQKGYGANAWIEGPLPPKGSIITVLEDVVTTGKSAIQAVLRLRDAGYIVNHVVTIVDRQDEHEASDAMASAGLELISLFSLEELIS